MKFTAKSKDGVLTVKARAWFGENIDERVLDAFSCMRLRGFMKPKFVRKGLAEYTGPTGVSLHTHLQKPISKRNFFMIIEQIMMAVQKLRMARMLPEYMILDIHNVYINETTLEVQFLFVPLLEHREETDVIAFMKSVLYTAKPEKGENEFLTDFVYFLNSLDQYMPDKIEKYIAKVDPQALKLLRKRNPGSGFITNKRMDYLDYQEKLQESKDRGIASGEIGKNAEPDTYVMGEEDDLATDVMDEEDDFATDVMDEEDDFATDVMDEEDDFATDVMDEEDDFATDVMDEEDDFATDVMVEEDDFATDVMVEEDDFATDVMVEEDEFATDVMSDGDDLATDLFEDDAPTGLLEDEDDWSGVQPRENTPYLIRESTGERIDIDQYVFRLGRSSSNVHYTIQDNNKIGRVHAELTIRGGCCYVTDLTSKNGTFVNECRVAPQCETQLHDGDILMLANDRLAFHQ